PGRPVAAMASRARARDRAAGGRGLRRRDPAAGLRPRRPAQCLRTLVTNLLFFRIATPAGIIAIALGMVLIGMVPFGAWLAAKLLVVMAAVLLHLYFGL